MSTSEDFFFILIHIFVVRLISFRVEGPFYDCKEGKIERSKELSIPTDRNRKSWLRRCRLVVAPMESTIKSFAPTRRFPTMSSWPKCILKYGYGWVNLATKKLQSSSYGPKRGKVIFEVRPYWQSSLFIATYSSSHFDRSWEVKPRCNSIVFGTKMKIHAIFC